MPNCVHRVNSQRGRGTPFDNPYTCTLKADMPGDRDDTLCLGICAKYEEWDGRYDGDACCALATRIIDGMDLYYTSPYLLSRHWIVRAMGITADEIRARWYQHTVYRGGHHESS